MSQASRVRGFSFGHFFFLLGQHVACWIASFNRIQSGSIRFNQIQSACLCQNSLPILGSIPVLRVPYLSDIRRSSVWGRVDPSGSGERLHQAMGLIYSNPYWNPWRIGIYPLVNIQKPMERSTIFNGKTHYKWAIFHSYVSLPEGIGLGIL